MQPYPNISTSPWPKEHIRTHITDPAITCDAECTQGADELIDILRAYIK